MNELTIKQQNEILKILNENKYIDSHGNNIPTKSVIFKAFYHYAKLKKIINKGFKFKYFRKEKHVFHPYGDCPLSKGQVLSAIRYGSKNSFLKHENTSKNHLWYFINRGKYDG